MAMWVITRVILESITHVPSPHDPHEDQCAQYEAETVVQVYVSLQQQWRRGCVWVLGLPPRSVHTYLRACLSARVLLPPIPPPLPPFRGGAVSELLEKLRMKPTDIDILVTCTSLFCPTPSPASMLVNKWVTLTAGPGE